MADNMKTLTDKQRERKDLLLIIANLEGKSLLDIIRAYRKRHNCSLGEAIDGLYNTTVIKKGNQSTFFFKALEV